MNTVNLVASIEDAMVKDGLIQQNTNQLYQQYSPYKTPQKLGVMQNQSDIRQVTQIFESMKLDMLNHSPQVGGRTPREMVKSYGAAPIGQSHIRDFQYQQAANQSPINMRRALTPRAILNQQSIQKQNLVLEDFRKCAREGCIQTRCEVGGQLAQHCSKSCQDGDERKGAIQKNQDAIYAEAAKRQRSQTRSPINNNHLPTKNFASDAKSPSRAVPFMLQQQNPMQHDRSRSPISRSAIDQYKKHSIFSSESESDHYHQQYTPMVPMRQQTLMTPAPENNFIRKLNFDRNQQRQQYQQPLISQNSQDLKYSQRAQLSKQRVDITQPSHTLNQHIPSSSGVFAQSHFARFLQEKQMEHQKYRPQSAHQTP